MLLVNVSFKMTLWFQIWEPLVKKLVKSSPRKITLYDLRIFFNQAKRKIADRKLDSFAAPSADKDIRAQ